MKNTRSSAEVHDFGFQTFIWVFELINEKNIYEKVLKDHFPSFPFNSLFFFNLFPIFLYKKLSHFAKPKFRRKFEKFVLHFFSSKPSFSLI